MWSFLGCIKYEIHANQYWATIESQNTEAEKGLSNEQLLGSREILGGVWLTQEASQHPFLVLILSPPFSTWKSGQRGVLERAPNPIPHCQQSWSGNPKLSIYALNHHTPLPYLSSHFMLDGKIREEQFLHVTLGSFTGTWPRVHFAILEDGSSSKHHCGGLWGWPGSPSASHLALPLPLLFFMCRVSWFTVGQPGDTKKLTYANEVYTLQKLCKFLSTLLRKKKWLWLLD